MPKKNNQSSGIVYSTDPSFKSEEESISTEKTAPAQQNLQISFETKHRAGKAVTIIWNYKGSDDEMELLGKQLKTHCGTGGSVKDREILIQGDHRKKVFDWLIKNGYKKTKM